MRVSEKQNCHSMFEKIHWVYIAPCLVFALIVSCTVHVPLVERDIEKRANLLQPPEHLAKLYLFREKAWKGGVWNAKVWIDKAYWGEISTGTFLCTLIPPGNYLLDAKFYRPMDGADGKIRSIKKPIFIKSGETQYYTVGPSSGRRMEKLTIDEAVVLIDTYRLSAANELSQTLVKEKLSQLVSHSRNAGLPTSILPEELNVIQHPIPVRDGPQGQYFIGYLGVGDRVVILDKKSDWSEIQSNNGLVGWILTAELKGSSIRSPSKQKQSNYSENIKYDYGKFYALVIGNNSYQFLPNLKTAINDAFAVSTMLKRKYNFQVQLIRDAKRHEIMKSLRYYRELLGSEDNFLLYYAGHGDIDKDTKRGYWLPTDADPKNRTNWVSIEDITNDISAIKAMHVLVVADSCYSGTLYRAAYTEPIKDGGTDAWIQKVYQKKSRTALTAGGLEPVVDAGKNGNHSVFANSFLTALEENNRIIDMGSLFEFIKRQVVLNAKQTPTYKDIRFAGVELGGDFVFIPREKR